MEVNYNLLLADYRMLWNNRLLETERLNSELTLKEAVKRELLDENSHPRVRKNKFEKYYSAVTRIVNSTSLNDDTKILLIKVYNEVLEELIKE
nr:hypothetical protein [Neobacillus sp. Marseille-Q6967]